MDSIRLSTILLPDADIALSAVTTSELYANEGDVSFTLNDHDCLPHITLYFPEYPRRNLAGVVEAVQKMAENMNSLTLTLASVSVTETGGISANYRAEDALIAFRQRVIQALNPLREGYVLTKYTFANATSLTDLEKREIETYGYIFSRYHFPHITLSHFKEVTEAKKALEKLGEGSLPKTCSIKRLAISEVGIHGTATKILAEFELS